MFKKLLCIAAALAVSVLFGTVCYAETEFEDVEVNVPPQMLFLGDSIASGYGLDGYDTGRENCRSYANILAGEYSGELSQSCGFSMTNLAEDGQTSSELLEKMNNGKYDDDIKNADCIVISIGGNDLLGIMLDTIVSSGIGGDSSSDISFDLKSLISGIKDMSERLDKNLDSFDENISGAAGYIRKISSAEIIVQTLYNPLEDFEIIPSFKKLADEKIGKLNEIINSHSEDRNGGYTVCDVASAFSGKSKELTRISQLDIHPNSKGHEVIASCVDKSVRSRSYSYKKAIEASAEISKKKPTALTAALAGSVIILTAFSAFAVRMIISAKRNRH